MIDMNEAAKTVEEKLRVSDALVDSLLVDGDFRDDDGYPTEDFLRLVLNWTWNRPQKELFDLIHDVWWMADWGWKEGECIDEVSNDKTYIYYISTGGWSGNESIIQAMKQNEYFLWHKVWVQSRRGGHYIFELDEWNE